MVFWRVHALYLSADNLIYVTSLSVVSYYGNSAHASDKQHMHFLQGDDVVSHVTSVLGIHVMYSARLREGVPYVKLYRYNPKHLCPKFNGYGDNGQRKVCSSDGSTHCTCQLTALSMLRRVRCHITAIQLTLAINSICTSFRVMT